MQTTHALRTRCLHLVQMLASQNQWRYSATEMEFFADAIFSYAKSIDEIDDAVICKIICNYRKEGADVMEMLTPDAPRHENLWQQWQEQVVLWLRKKGAEKSELDDLVQDIYLQMPKALAAFKFRSKLSTYFCSVAENHYFMRLRKKNRSVERPANGLDSLNIQLADSGLTPEDKVILEERRLLLLTYLQEILKESTFQIIYLYYFEQTYIDPETRNLARWTDKAIAAKLELSDKAVESRRARTVKKLIENSWLIELLFEILGINFKPGED
ncbi:MAG: sigma-70 family RNA polymerase sigma factor [Chloroflexota bacterium]